MKGFKGKILKTLVLAVLIVLVISVFAFYMVGDFLVPYGFLFFAVRDAQQRRVRLLCETDHQALLEACNELSKQVVEGNLKPGTYSIYREPDPEASRFPQPILDLVPSYVSVSENDSRRVMLEMLGGLGHFGVLAYTEDYKKPYPTYSYGDKKLIPGLWYYDDGYQGHPEYEKRIEALMKKGNEKAK